VRNIYIVRMADGLNELKGYGDQLENAVIWTKSLIDTASKPMGFKFATVLTFFQVALPD
jgi:hypothetical protein